jgi:uncharacterized membrane protein SpoIIM required for sporulation
MTPQEFTRRHEASWEHFRRLLDQGRREPQADFPRLYREICTHLALARDRHYPLALVDRLNLLALEGQQRLYRHQGGLWQDCLSFVGGGFPALLRRHAGLFWLLTVLLYGPALIMGLAVYHDPALVYSVMAPKEVHMFEEMYAPGKQLIGARGADTNLLMFGYYVMHNTGIGFETFAGGIFFGIGSLFTVIFNGVELGVVAGYLTQLGYGRNFWSFVVTHSAFELTAVVISGMAGVMLGLALVAPGQQTRRDALVSRGRDAVRLIYGAAGMFFIAAIFEGFWSSSTSLPPALRFSVAGGCWLLVSLYFLFAGRRGPHAS